MPHLARRGELVAVVPVAPDLASPPEHAVHRAGESNREALDTSRQGLAALRLHEQVDVVALHGKVTDTEDVTALRAADRLPQHAKDVWEAEGREAADGAQGDVRGVARVVVRPDDVRHAGLRPGGFPTGAGPAATACARDRQRELPRTSYGHDALSKRAGSGNAGAGRREARERVRVV